MKKAITIATVATVGVLVGVLNRLHRGHRKFNLAEGRPTAADIDKMTPRQLRQLEREQDQFLQAIYEHQTC